MLHDRGRGRRGLDHGSVRSLPEALGDSAAEIVGIYRTYWSLLDREDPSKVIRSENAPLLDASPELTRPLEDKMYLRDVVFTTGIVDAGEHFIVASGEADLACRITYIPKDRFKT